MNDRRHAHDAGPSWRKWGDPLIYGAVGPDWTGWSRFRVLVFWLFCLDVGIWAALLVGR